MDHARQSNRFNKRLKQIKKTNFHMLHYICRDMKEFSRSHSILVSGESGAGKTETCKLLMGYLAYMIGQEEAQAGGGAGPAANGNASGQKTLQEKVRRLFFFRTLVPTISDIFLFLLCSVVLSVLSSGYNRKKRP